MEIDRNTFILYNPELVFAKTFRSLESMPLYPYECNTSVDILTPVGLFSLFINQNYHSL